MRVLLAAISVAVLLFVGSMVANRFWTRSEVRWESRVEGALQEAAVATARGDSLADAARLAQKEADKLRKDAVTFSRQVQERVVDARVAAVPDTCREIVALRDSLIDEALESADIWKATADAQLSAAQVLGLEVTTLRTTNNTLRETLEARPKPRSPLFPSAGAGMFAGLCASGPCYGVGLTLSWKVSF